LGGLPVEETPSGCLRVTGISPRDVLAAWRAARSVVPVTGRWPVFTSNDFGRYDPLGTPRAVDLTALDDAARSVDPWSAVTSAWGDEPIEADELCLYVPTFEGVDLLTEVRQQLRSPTTGGVDRWVFDQVVADPRLRAQAFVRAESLRARSWHEPRSVELWLLPTARPHLAAAWVHYNATLGLPAEVLAAALWQWHQAWEAELVATWDTMLQFVVGRSPILGEEAWLLAGQQKTFANHLEDDQWLVALALTQATTWFLHDRP
jgi:hypothetical protein